MKDPQGWTEDGHTRKLVILVRERPTEVKVQEIISINPWKQ